MVETIVRDRWNTWTNNKVTLGMCPRCGKNPIKPGKNCCTACTLKARRRRSRLYNQRLRKGLCPHCGGKREDPGIIGCRKCNEKNALRRVKFYDKGKKALYQRRLYWHRHREGVCPVCGQAVDAPQFKVCLRCRQQGRDNYYLHRESRIERNLQYYRLNHKPKPLCSVCGHHRLRCESCGKMMKAHHGEDSCLFTCKCGSLATFTREAIQVFF